MADVMNKSFGSNSVAPRVRRAAWRALAGALVAITSLPAFAAITCQREVTANVVAIDQPIMYNRLGASNINGMMYALKRDVIPKGSAEAGGALDPVLWSCDPTSARARWCCASASATA